MSDLGTLHRRWLLFRELRGCIATWAAEPLLRQPFMSDDILELATTRLDIDEMIGEDLLFYPPMSHLMDKDDALWWVDLWLDRWPAMSQDLHPMHHTIELMDLLRDRLADRKFGIARGPRSGPATP